MEFKKVLYWTTLVGPIVDIVTGLFTGLYDAFKDCPDNVRKIQANRKYLEQVARFYSETPYQDMTDAEFEEEFNPKSKKKGKKKNG